MKKKIFFLKVFCVFILFCVNLPINAQINSHFKNKFTLGAFNYFPFSPDSFYANSTQINYYKQLSFNFLEGHNGDGAYSQDLLGTFQDPISRYWSNVNSMLNAWQTNFGNSASIMTDDKIAKPCNGQLSIYQAEDRGTWHSVFPGYGYDTIGVGTDTTETWGGESFECVRAKTGRDGSGYILRKLYENKEQVNGNWGSKNDINTYWFVKPKMRIDPTFAFANQSTPVAAIIIKDFWGVTVDSIIITCRQFIQGGSYDGSFREAYDFPGVSPYKLSFHGSALVDDTVSEARMNFSKVDYQVYWFGNCDVSIDYVKIDNEIANFLFNPAVDPNNYDFSYVQKILNATDSLTTGTYSGGKRYSYFYFDEFEYNMIPSIAEVNRLIKSVNPNSGVICLFSQNKSDWWLKTSLKNIPTYPEAMEYLKSSGAIKDIFFSEPYPFEDWIPLPPDTRLPDTIANPGTHNYWKAASNNIYNDSMNSFIERNHMRNFRDVSSAVKNTDIIFSLCTQVHSFELYRLQTGDGYYVLREPLNEEIKMQNFLGLAYGAKQIIYFIYQSFYNVSSNYSHNYGMLEFPTGSMTKRDTNYYGQKKWDSVARHDSALVKMGEYIINQKKLKWDAARTVYFEGLPFKYVDNIKSIYSDPSALKGSSNNTDAFNEDTKKYWEMGFFDANSTVEPATSSYTKYLLAVNRRCAPNTVGVWNDGDIRTLQVKFRSTDLPVFNNWKVYDAMTNTLLGTFDKNGTGYVSVGTFQPGEGKLFKLIPVMIDGGTFVTHESLRQIDFSCNGTVYTNGYNLTLEEGVNIDFKNNVQLKMKKGKFLSGVFPSPRVDPERSYLKGLSGANWNGIYFDSTEVNMGFISIKDVTKNAAANSGYVLNFIDCDTVNVIKTYITTTDSSGCINMYYHSGGVTNPLINLTYDSLNVNINGNPPLNMYSVSSLSGSFKAEHNVIKNFNGSGGGTGTIMTGFAHFYFNDNFYRSFARAIYSIHSSPDFWANVFNNGAYGGYSYNIYGEYSTVFDFSSTVGGYNTVTNFSGECVKLDASYVDIHNGGNYFSVYDTLGYHLRGYFQSGKTNTNEDGRGNCFLLHDNVKDSAHVRINVILGDLTPVNYRLLPFASGCNPSDNTNTQKSSVTDQSIIKNDNASDKQKPLKEAEVNSSKSLSGITESKNELSQSLYAEMKKALKNEDYKLAAEKSKAILESGVENMYSVDAVRKLFHSVSLLKNKPSKQTTKQTKAENKTNNVNTAKTESKELSASVPSSMSDLKSYYESYIQSHSANTAIVAEMFYFIQKCRINLGDYEAALNGYKAIMEKNPYSMAGLNAKWEYSDLQMLVASKSNGKSGGENNTAELLNYDNLNEQQQYERLVSLIEDPKDGPRDGKKTDSPDNNKKAVTDNVIKSLNVTGEKDKSIVKLLEDKIAGNQASTEEVKEYKKKMLYKELIKIERANNISEQIAMVQRDLSKILALDNASDNVSLSKELPVIAYDYKLNQNYPNPFNPSTKISYEIKAQGFVSLKIYDLLGREIAELVNETKEAGRYTLDFNASKYSLSSGIYFYRIKAGEFVDTKRMVLVK